jgi:homoserine dehydrogenase
MRVILAGLGNVGRNLLAILESQATLLSDRYGLTVQVVGVADSKGAALDPTGLDVASVRSAKAAGRSVGTLADIGRMGMTPLELLREIEADLVFEATPVDLATGQPGLDLIREALGRGLHAVVANKGPLALAYPELAAASDLAAIGAPALRFSACVGGALPTINLGRRDLAGARILEVEAILNGTCQGILRAMEMGQDFASAVAEMQRRGVAETDPSLDIDGWDQAVKLVILANAVLGRPTVLADVSVRGIRGITLADLQAADRRGERLVLLGRAAKRPPERDWTLTVAPTALPKRHRLARMEADEMGVVYHTDVSGILHATSEEANAVPTAAAMLRDLIEIAGGRPESEPISR